MHRTSEDTTPDFVDKTSLNFAYVSIFRPHHTNKRLSALLANKSDGKSFVLVFSIVIDNHFCTCDDEWKQRYSICYRLYELPTLHYLRTYTRRTPRSTRSG